MKKQLLRFLASEDGPTAVEYAVMLALIMGAVVAGIGLLGGGTGNLIEDSSNQMSSAGLGS
jgi:pilus assembly protein Flp/PilA